MAVSTSWKTYAAWESGDYAAMEAAPRYVELMGVQVTITRTLPSSGALQTRRLRSLVLGGTLASSGTLPRQATHRLTGTLASSGVVLIGKIFLRSIGGAIAPTGLLRRGAARTLGGVLTPTGTVNIGLTRLLGPVGVLRSSGELQMLARYLRSFGGVLGASGSVTARFGYRRVFGNGSLGLSGRFCFFRAIFLGGEMRPWGRLDVHVLKGRWPTLKPIAEPAPPTLAGVGATAVPPLLGVTKSVAPMAGKAAGGTLRPLLPAPRPGPPPLRGTP